MDKGGLDHIVGVQPGAHRERGLAEWERRVDKWSRKKQENTIEKSRNGSQGKTRAIGSWRP